MKKSQTQFAEAFSKGLLLACALVVALLLISLTAYLLLRGGKVLSWSFVTSIPSEGMTRGGILTPIIGTVTLTLITALVSLPIGIAAAVYLSEYASNNRLTQITRAAIRNLAGVPSIIFGLFGLALFVQGLGLGSSLLAAGFTLGLLSLPYIITTTEEAIRAIPQLMRESALALGATRWEVTRDIILPSAIPGIATGAILSLARAAGETAPILFTGATFYLSGNSVGLLDEFMALPYHLYMLVTQHQAIEKVQPIAFGTACVLLLIVLVLNLVAMRIRKKYIKNYQV
ncbi:MAG: phosphate ABC transporter permease PstA [Cytophagales bacterium]|nr:phosphate ABC transporter permease PstA [Bernardetiaceae bacterium]MDW8211423.1 phosphate ABC transporter permease PstA [Cytophagales bacterium]